MVIQVYIAAHEIYNNKIQSLVEEKPQSSITGSNKKLFNQDESEMVRIRSIEEAFVIFN